MLTRRSLLIGVGSMAPTALLATALPKGLFGFDDRWACRVRDQLARQRGGQPPPRYTKRLEEELSVIHHRGWQSWFDAALLVASAARASGLVVHHDMCSLTGSLVAHVLGITALDPVVRGVPFGRMKFSPNDPHVEVAVSAQASLEFLDTVRVAAPEMVVDGPTRKGHVFEWIGLRFGRLYATPEVRLLRLPALDVVQDAVDRGMSLSRIDLDDLSKMRLHLGPLPPPFDSEEWAWVLDSCESFEDLAAALRLMQVEGVAWVDDEQRVDWWRLFFAGRSDLEVQRACDPYLRSTHELLLYQEQIGSIAHGLAGIPLSDMHLLRRGLGTRHPAKLAFWRHKFINGALVKSGLNRAEAASIFDFIERDYLLTWSRGGAVGETALWIWGAHATRYLAAA